MSDISEDRIPQIDPAQQQRQMSELMETVRIQGEQMEALLQQNAQLQQQALMANKPITSPDDLPFDEGGQFRTLMNDRGEVIQDPTKVPVGPGVDKKWRALCLEANTLYLSNRANVDRLSYNRNGGIDHPQVLAVLLLLIERGVLDPKE